MAKKKDSTEVQRRQPPDLPVDMDELAGVTAEELSAGLLIDEGRAVGGDLSGRKLLALDARVSVFEGVSFAGCEISTVRLRDSRFVRCDLSNARVRGIQATRVAFVDCRLTGLAGIECVWQDVLLENCDGRYAQFTDGRLHGFEAVGTDLSEADLRGVSLENATFSGVNLARADLSGARLRHADLRGADIDGITVGADDVRGAIVTPAQAIGLAPLLGISVR